MKNPQKTDALVTAIMRSKSKMETFGYQKDYDFAILVLSELNLIGFDVKESNHSKSSVKKLCNELNEKWYAHQKADGKQLILDVSINTEFSEGSIVLRLDVGSYTFKPAAFSSIQVLNNWIEGKCKPTNARLKDAEPVEALLDFLARYA